MSRHDRMMSLARKMAEKNPYPGYKMCAVVTSGGRIIAKGFNKLQPGVLKHPIYKKKAIHCELDAILSVDREKLQGATIYVAGISKGGNGIKSMCCPLCMQVLQEYGLKTVVYHENTGELKIVKVS